MIVYYAFQTIVGYFEVTSPLLINATLYHFKVSNDIQNDSEILYTCGIH